MLRAICIALIVVVTLSMTITIASAADPSFATRTEVDPSGAFKTMGAVNIDGWVYDVVFHLNPGWMEVDAGRVIKTGEKSVVIPCIGVDAIEVDGKTQLCKVYPAAYFYDNADAYRLESWFIIGLPLDGSGQQMFQAKEIGSVRIAGPFSVGAQFDCVMVSDGKPTLMGGGVIEHRLKNGSVITFAHQAVFDGGSHTSVVAQINW